MKKKILTRTNALIVFFLGVLGFAGCERSVKYGPGPEPEPVPLYGVPMPEQVQDAPESPVSEPNE